MRAQVTLRAQRSNPDCSRGGILDCFAPLAMTDERGSVPLDDLSARREPERVSLHLFQPPLSSRASHDARQPVMAPTRDP